jgi:hypothetical protein
LHKVKNWEFPYREKKPIEKKTRYFTNWHWKDDERPPEQITQYYGPATWAEDGSWGYHTPIYMLKCIICLQAVTEIITNETARTLDILVQQHTKVHNEIYQNHLALDYLLASEGGVCGKFNLSNCCLQIGDEGKVVEEIADRMRKLAHVPVQTWRGWDPNDCLEDGSLPWADSRP